jgi:hypothetical protein
MKEFYFDQHSIICPCGKETKAKGWDKFCEINPERFLFFVGTKFVLITYHSCMGAYDEYDFKKILIQKVIDDSQIFDYYEIVRSSNLKDTLQDFRIRNQSLRKNIQQVNYIYSDLCGKEYAITTQVDYLDWLCNQDEIDKNYTEAKNMITKNQYDWLLPQLQKLYIANKVYNENETEYCKSIDHIIQEINQYIK